MRKLTGQGWRGVTSVVLGLAVGGLLPAPTARADGDKLKLKTTLNACAEVAKAVGGDAVEVEALTRPTEDPHDITPTPQLIVKLKDADVFIENGIGLESWSEKCVAEAK